MELESLKYLTLETELRVLAECYEEGDALMDASEFKDVFAQKPMNIYRL